MSTSLRVTACAVCLAVVGLLGTAGSASAAADHGSDLISADAHWCC
jgi:hypothetical protein